MNTITSGRGAAGDPESALYSRLLGATWANLDERVRHVHDNGAEKRGVFRIAHGDGWFASQAIRSSHLPHASNAAETSLNIFAAESGEKWERSFNGEKFVTVQWDKRGKLAERFGSWELEFALCVDQGALVYKQCGALYCIGQLRLRMPLVCAPRVEAREWADDSACVRVVVKVVLPVIGLLIAYDGHLILETKSS